MAKVYSWEVKRNPRTYAYIIHPDSVTYESDKAVSTSNPKAYIGAELKGAKLQKVVDWVQNVENNYEAQFQIMVNTCATDERAKNAVFDTVSSYIDLPGTCDLRGPAGRGIVNVTYSHSLNGESVYIIKYDDGTEDSFIVRDGKDGKDGIDGKPGAKGDAGISSKLIMIYTTGKDSNGELKTPERPEGGSYDFLTGKPTYPDGWAPNDNGIIPPVWMSSRTFTTSELSTDPEWSIPVQITGENGAPGVDGVSTEFIYKRTKVKPTEVGELPSVNENGYVPTDWGWTPSPLGVTEDDPTEWCCIRRMIKNVGWGPWDGPTIWSQYGVNGQDGDGVQYIYMRNKGELPENPTPFGWDDPTSAYQDKDLEWVPEIGSYTNYVGNPINLTEEFYWSDNPNDVDASYQYQWVAVRKYKKGDDGKQSWQPFSNPSLWGKYGQDGNNGTSIRTLYALSTSTSNPPTVPTTVTETVDWGSGFPKDYEFGENVVWGITAEIWSHNNEFVNPEIGWSKPFLVTGVKGKDGDAINYNSRYFAYGWVNSTPYPPSSTDPNNIGTSLDGLGNIVVWRDYPDTKNVGSDNEERRWYQCDVHINGDNQQIEKYGPVLPCNGRDGSAIPGKYTEFRFAVTPTEDAPILVQFNDEGLIIREPKLFNEDESEQWGWFSSDKELPELKTGGAVWEIWATIDGAKEEVVIQSDGTGWSGPIRVSGERGEQGIQGPAGLRGITGIPGAMVNPMYCLGTKGRQEIGESFFENGDGYFGSDLWKDNVLPEALTGWYKTPPYSDFLDATSTTEVSAYASLTNNIGRIIRYISVEENSGVTETYYTYYIIEALNTLKDIKKNVPKKDELDIYIWSIQGKDIWKAGTVGEGEEGDTVKHERIGVDWSDPFRLQGTNGLRGLTGNKGQVVYPKGVYNQEEIYITTEDKAPYVYDPNDGLFYVYNIANKPWVGKLPSNYKTVKVDKNGKVTEDGEFYKYSIDGTYGNWIGDQNGDTPSQNYANHTDEGSTPAWVRFESFEALYTSIGIIANGMIGSAVYNNEFMFSQQGLAADGKTFSTEYEKFLDGYQYDEKGKTENGETKNWYYKGTTQYISDRNVNPYEHKSEIDATCIHGFQPNVCINFRTGEMWLSGGKVNFDATGAGYLAKQYINWTNDGTVVIGKPGESSNGIIINDQGMTIGPLDAYKLEMSGTIKGINSTIDNLSIQINNDLANLQNQVDKKAETYYQEADPSTQWADDEKSEHVGDMWYNTTNHNTYRWNGSKWEQQDIPLRVFDIIDGKSAIFVEMPTTDKDGDGYVYKINDMWLLESDYTSTSQLGPTGKQGSIWVSTKNATSFAWADWVKKGTELDNWVLNEFTSEIDAIRLQVDGKANTHYGPNDPSTEWLTTTNDKNKLASEHIGDLWFDTNVNKSYTYTNSIANIGSGMYKNATPTGYYWVESNIPQDVFDKLDGKSSVFVETPTIPWNKGDLWLKDGEIYRAICDRETGTASSYLTSDWIPACEYTNDDTALRAIGRLNAMGEDGYVSPDERKQLKQELTIIEKEYTSLIAQAKSYGMDSSTSSFNQQYNDYINKYTYAKNTLTYYTDTSNVIQDEEDTHYGYIDILNDGTSSTDVTAYGNIAEYYVSKQNLLNALISYASSSGQDLEYLQEVFGIVSTNNGATLSKFLGVTTSGTSANNVVAYMDGSGMVKNSAGTSKLIFASGIPTGTTTLSTRATNAQTKIYDDGTFETKKGVFSGKIQADIAELGSGDFLIRDGIVSFYPNTTSNIAMFGGDSNGLGFTSTKSSIKYNYTFGDTKVDRGTITSYGFDGTTKSYNLSMPFQRGALFSMLNTSKSLSNYTFPTYTALNIVSDVGSSSYDSYAISCASGMHGGLRPSIITSSSSSYTADLIDHTIIMTKTLEKDKSGNSNHTIQVYIPRTPPKGQEYVIIHTGAAWASIEDNRSHFIVNLTGTGTSTIKNVNQGGVDRGTTIEWRGVRLECRFYFDGTYWWVTYNSWEGAS